MTVTALAIGDPHFQVNNVSEINELVTKIHILVDNYSALDFVVLLGDTLHTHEKIHTIPFNLATEFITSLALKIPVFLLIGNHDYINNQQFLTDNHPFNSFKSVDYVTVCDKVTTATIKGLTFVFCPYVPPERFEEALNTVSDWRKASCIFAHQEFYGCRLNPVITSVDGDLWPENYPLVISGHIHESHQLQKNVYYTGSSMYHSFGEGGKKTVALLTFDKNGHKLQKIDLEMKRKEIVYITVSKAGSFVPKKDVQTKLVIKGTSEELQVFRKSKEYRDLVKQKILVSFLITTATVEDKAIPTIRKTTLEILQDLVSKEDTCVQDSFEKFKTLLDHFNV